MAITNQIIQELLPLLRPLMEDEKERRAYLIRALGTDAPVLHRLVWNIPVNVFIPNMVRELVDFGEITRGQPALCALLEVIREDVGEDVKVDIDEVLQKIREELKKLQPPQGTWTCSYTLCGHSESVESVAISPDGWTLASGSGDKTIQLWDLSTGRLLCPLKGHSTVVRSLAFSPDGKTLVSSSNVDVQDGNIKLWDVGTGKLRGSLGGGLSNFRVSCIAISPEGQTLASGQLDGTIKLWDLSTGKVQATLWGHGIDINSVAFSSDGKILVAGCFKGAITIWDWYHQKLLRTVNLHSGLIGSIVSWFNPYEGLMCLVMSPDGSTIACCGQGQPIQLLSDTGTLLHTLTGHSGNVYSIAFSPDGYTLASGGEDKTIRIWNVHTGQLLRTLEHSGVVNCVAFSPNGTTLVSGGDDKAIKVWRVSL